MINSMNNIDATNTTNQGSCCGVPTSESNKMPVAIIGAGPVGLAAAAHLISREESFVLFDEGEDVGANIMKWAHVRLFSPWEFNIIRLQNNYYSQTVG